MLVTVISYPNNEINFSQDVPETTNSNKLVSLVWVNVSETTQDEYIEINYNSETITLLIEEECRYKPIDIHFQNKEGAQQVLTFFKKHTESTATTAEEFQSYRGQPRHGNHQFVKYNVQGRSKIKMNSGFVEEQLNESFKQLLYSERIWSLEDGIFTPLNIGTSSLEYKTRSNDRLINYEIEFMYAFNEVNNV